MRRIGILTDEAHASRFSEYLVTQQVRYSIDVQPVTGSQSSANGASQTQFEVWIRDEKDVPRARQFLQEFMTNPTAAKFEVKALAEQMRIREAAESGSLRPTLVPVGGNRISSSQQYMPVTMAVLAISIVVSLATNLGDPKSSTSRTVFAAMCLLDARDVTPEAPNPDPWTSLKKGEIWRVITPMFLHGSMMHLAFNMMWVYSLGSIIERMHGSRFFTLLLLGTQTIGMLVQVYFPQAWGGSPFAIGASGAVYGMFGYLWLRPMVDPEFPFGIAPVNVALMLGWLVLCFTSAVPNVANGAHVGGLIAGLIAAPLATRFQS